MRLGAYRVSDTDRGHARESLAGSRLPRGHRMAHPNLVSATSPAPLFEDAADTMCSPCASREARGRRGRSSAQLQREHMRVRGAAEGELGPGRRGRSGNRHSLSLLHSRFLLNSVA